MGGPKQLKSVIICPESCCYGYHEERAYVPYNGLVVWCQKDEPTERVSVAGLWSLIYYLKSFHAWSLVWDVFN
jgi:hypothetical protein